MKMADREKSPIEYWYEKWILDCQDSILYCELKNETSKANAYRDRKEQYEKRLKELRNEKL